MHVHVYSIHYILYRSPSPGFKMQMSLFWLKCLGSSEWVTAHIVLLSLGPQPAQAARLSQRFWLACLGSGPTGASNLSFGRRDVSW